MLIEFSKAQLSLLCPVLLLVRPPCLLLICYAQYVVLRRLFHQQLLEKVHFVDKILFEQCG